MADDNCWFELYTPSTSAEDYDLINGFKKITSEKELKAGVSVLIVTKADAQVTDISCFLLQEVRSIIMWQTGKADSSGYRGSSISGNQYRSI